MISIEEKEDWYYLAVKRLSALLRGITSKQDGELYCLNFLRSFKRKYKLKSHAKVCKNKDLCGTVMPSEINDILEFNKYMKSDEIPCIIYADIETLIKK